MAYSFDDGVNWVRADIPDGGAATNDTHILFLAADIGSIQTIVEPSDDAGPDAINCQFSTSHPEIYLGECFGDGHITSGFRFKNVPITHPDEIQSAWIEFTVDGDYDNDIHVQFFGEASNNAESFTNIRNPSDRYFTNNAIDWIWGSSDLWETGQKKNSPDLTPIIKEIVEQPGWQSGNALSIIVKNAGSNGNHRRVYAYERGGNRLQAARLVLRFGHSISGQLMDVSGSPLSGVIISSDAGHIATTNINGNYILNGLSADTYIITPSKSGYTFSPLSRTVTVPPNATGQDFVVESVSGAQVWGRVTDDFGNPIFNVTISDNVGHATTTIEDGSYDLSGLSAGTYKIIPSKPFYKFEPIERTVSVPPGVAAVNFTATYDCSVGGNPLSYIADAVAKTLQSSHPFCNNRYERLSFVPGNPPGYNTAYHDIAKLVRSAQYEVLFSTLFYDKDNDPSMDSPGDMLADALADLYCAITETPEKYPKGLTVRVLVSNTGSDDQRLFILQDFREAVIARGKVPKMVDSDIGWTFEITDYFSVYPIISWNHSKLIVVDGKTVLAGGFNMTNNHLYKEYLDFGVQVTGPVAQAAQKAFDTLWERSIDNGLRCDLATIDWTASCEDNYTNSMGHVPEALKVHADDGGKNVFSLFRTHQSNEQEADYAVEAALGAAQKSIAAMHVNFMPHGAFNCAFGGDYNFDEDALEYMKGLRDAVVKNQGDIDLKLLFTSPQGYQKIMTECGIRVFLDELGTMRDVAKIKWFNESSHAKTVLIDEKFLIVGSQNWEFAAFGEGGLAEYSLGVEDQRAARDYLSYFNNFWENKATEYSAITQNEDLKTKIENAADGAIISLYGDNYLISEPININKKITIISLGTMLKPSVKVASKTASQEQSLLKINASNVEIIGLIMKNALGYAIEIGDSLGKPLKNISITNSVFANNALGGIKITQSTAHPLDYNIESNTFVGSSSGVTIDVQQRQADTASIRHNIFLGQSVAPIQIISEEDGNVEYSYNLFYNCGTIGDCAANWHEGNLSSGSMAHDNLFDLDPLFVCSDSGDYRLKSGSPAIDAGDPSIWSSVFFDGDDNGIPRIDIGAFEYVPFIDDSPPTPGPINNENIYAYPNPFNPDNENVTFRFRLSKSGNITIKVYDVSNQLVATVISDYPVEADEELSVSWDGRNDNGAIVANGTYFYIIESSTGERGVGKVAVLR
mgnify:FL=1